MKYSTSPSIFQRIELFRKGTKKAMGILNPETHCEAQALHDYYCDQDQLTK